MPKRLAARWDPLERGGNWRSLAHNWRMQQVLDRAVTRLPRGLEVEPRLIRGPPARLIAEASGDFGLMLVGSRGHGPESIQVPGRAVDGSLWVLVHLDARSIGISTPGHQGETNRSPS